MWVPAWDSSEERGRDVEADDADEAAEEHAQYCWDNRGGWDSPWPSLPITIRVKAEDGVVLDFDVDVEFDPVFTAALKTGATP